MVWNKNQFKHMGIIRTKMMLDTIVRKVRDHKWNYSTDIKKSYQIDSFTMSEVIESLLLGIPIGDMTVIEKYEDLGDVIIDGNLRVLIVSAYMNDLFPIESDFVPDSCNGKKFSELPEQYQKLIKKAYVVVTVVQKQADDQLKRLATINTRTNLWDQVEERCTHEGKHKNN